MEQKVPLFHCTQPCSNCPYRTDAPVRHWDKSEFEKLLKNENDFISSVYMCHKANGSVCVGWLMKQDENRMPCIALRLELTKHQDLNEYFDSLHSPAPLYKTVKQMIRANFPSLLKTKTK